MLASRNVALTALAAALVLLPVVAERNVTITNTSPAIRYGGKNITNPPSCYDTTKGDSIAIGQFGCFDLGIPGCVDTITMGRGNDSSASLIFEGSAIYINSVQSVFSPLYTVTLDGESEDVDGYWPGNGTSAVTCQTLFHRTGLDANVEHTITLSVKGISPQQNDRNRTLIFTLTSFIYTTEGEGDVTSSSTRTITRPTSTLGSETSSANDPGTSSPSEGGGGPDEGAGVALLPPAQIAFAFLSAIVSCVNHL